MPKFIPTLFMPVMVEAIQEGRKTMTRRIIKKKYSNTNIEWKEKHSGKTKVLVEMQNDAPGPVDHGNGKVTHSVKAYREVPWPYNVGDILWVKETHYSYGYWEKNGKTKPGKQKWKFVSTDVEILFNDNPPSSIFISRKQSLHPATAHWYKRSSLFMPKKAARIFLEVTDTKTELLHEITGIDAIKEGIEYYQDAGTVFMNYLTGMYSFSRAKSSFKSLWIKIHGILLWELNPQIWAIEFKKVSKPKNF